MAKDDRQHVNGKAVSSRLLAAIEAEDGTFVSAGLAHQPESSSVSVKRKPVAIRRPRKSISEVNERDLVTVKRLIGKHGKQTIFELIRKAV